MIMFVISKAKRRIMECTFRILAKDKKTFETLKKFASGWSPKGIVIIEKK